MRHTVLVHLGGAFVSAAVWGLATRVPFVPVAIAMSEIAGIWFGTTERPPWGTVRHLARAIQLGGTWAAIGLLVFR